MVALPAFTPVMVMVLPFTDTVAILVSLEFAVTVPLPLTVAVTVAVDLGYTVTAVLSSVIAIFAVTFTGSSNVLVTDPIVTVAVTVVSPAATPLTAILPFAASTPAVAILSSFEATL